MKAINQAKVGRHPAGGWAALYLAAAYLLAIPFFLLVVDYPSVTDPAEKVRLLVANQAGIHLMYLITYVFFGLVLAVLALALNERLKVAAPGVMRVATAVGLMWAVLLVASGLVFNAGMASVVALHSSSPAQAVSTWQAIEPVAQGLGGAGGEVLGGLWMLLVSIGGHRAAGRTKALTLLGLAVGIAGVISVIPPLNDAAIAFGMLQILWFVWLGFTLLRPSAQPGQLRVTGVVPA